MRFLRTGLILLVLAQMVVFVPSSSGQRLYDKRRDEQAQEAKKYIDSLLSGTVFDTQLTNLALLSKQDLEALLLGAQYETRSTVNRFIEWNDVNCFVASVKVRVLKKEDEITSDKTLSDDQRERLIKDLQDKAIKDRDKAINDLKTQIKKASDELAKLKRDAACKKDPNANFSKCLTREEEAACAKLPDPKPKACVEPDATAIESFFEGVGELEELAKQIKSLELKAVSPSVVKAGEAIKAVLDKLEAVFKNYQERMNRYNLLEGELMDLRIPLKQVALQALQVEAEHLNNIGEIQTRRELQEVEIEALIKEYEGLAGNLGYKADARCFCPTSKKEDASKCAATSPLDKVDGSIEMTLRDAVMQARNAEAALATAEKALPEAQRALADARPRFAEEERRLVQAVSSAVTPSARRRAEQALRRARDGFRSEDETLRKALVRAEQDLKPAKQRVLDTRNSLADTLEALHIATSLASYGKLPSKIADQLLAQENHAYSIRLSRVRARAYQFTVSTGVQRLALYHQGGIKPSLVAQMIQAASTVAIPPILAAR
jgi:hypothetical protein